MRKRVLVAAMVAAGVFGSVAAAFSPGTLSAEPGPNGHNDYGRCKAYFSGSQNGQDHKHQAGPFAALEAAAEENDQTVEEFCASATPGGK